MEEIFNTVLTTSFHASIVGLVIVLVKRILKNKINPGWHYLIWAVLILKLLIPFAPPSPASIFNAVSVATQNVDFAGPYIKDHREPPAITGKGKLPNNAAVNKTININAGFFEKAKRLAAYIWISVFVLSTAFVIYTNFAFRGKLKKRKKAAPEWIYKILEKCKQKMGVKSEIEIIVQDIINTPSLFGIFKPTLMISPAVLNLKKENMSYIILHELAHLKRRDIMANYLLLLLQMMHWFNPLIWWLFKIIRQDMEMAADETVLVLLESSERKEYGRTLISVLESFKAQKPSLKLVGMVDDAGNIERRLKMIKMADLFKYKRRLFVITGAMCFAILSFILLTNPMAKNSLQIGSYTLEIPDDFRVKTDTPGLITQKNTIFKFTTATKIISFNELEFEKNNVTVGGVQIISYEPGQMLFLPNHSEVKSRQEIKGLITKAVLVNLDMTQPAASKDASVKNENHLYLIFEKDGIAYDIYADSKYVHQTQLIKIAKSFRPSDNSGALRAVEHFGRNLKKVDKLAPEEVCREQIRENYGAYVAPSLLAEWIKDPSKAPGRYVSSPWPDRIQIKDIVKINRNKYMVDGDIVEITSVPDEAWKTGITLTVERSGKDWFITGWTTSKGFGR
ncbi:M56 family metallopeptidase [Thermoanaerobacterium sp. DL9XJH110]|uniref:M56 family metallopeptidase n=1 Tax=Thermoanaerobacterium sp. DL9XJH110 TaxID=3386643 RepID=UPI003BB4BD6B